LRATSDSRFTVRRVLDEHNGHIGLGGANLPHERLRFGLHLAHLRKPKDGHTTRDGALSKRGSEATDSERWTKNTTGNVRRQRPRQASYIHVREAIDLHQHAANTLSEPCARVKIAAGATKAKYAKQRPPHDRKAAADHQRALRTNHDRRRVNLEQELHQLRVH
jgi:hypothetical protein